MNSRESNRTLKAGDGVRHCGGNRGELGHIVDNCDAQRGSRRVTGLINYLDANGVGKRVVALPVCMGLCGIEGVSVANCATADAGDPQGAFVRIDGVVGLGTVCDKIGGIAVDIQAVFHTANDDLATFTMGVHGKGS